MNDFLSAVKGKKTYLAVVIGLLYLVGVWAGAWELREDVLAAVGFSGLAFLRSAVAKIGGTDTGTVTAGKLPLLVLAGALAMGGAGCTTPQDAAGKTLATAAITVDAAMTGWGEWVKAGQATVQDEIVVADAYQKYQAAMRVVKTAYTQSVRVGDITIYERAAEALRSSRTELLALVEMLEGKTPR